MAGKLPTDARFDAVIKGVLFPPEPNQLSPTKPLDLVLEALAKSVGLQTLIYREYDEKGAATIPRIPNIKFDFQGRKFRDIWDLLFNTYGLQLGLDFVVLGNNTIVVAPNELISGLSDASQRTGESQRQLYLVDIPAASYVDKEGKADYDKAKLWVKDNFIPFANREFGGLAINWLVVEGGKLVSVGGGKSETAVEVTILRVLVSVLGSESQQLRFQETLARSRYGFELLPTALELAAIQAASSPPEEPEKPAERIFTLRNINFAEITGFLVSAVPGVSVNPLPTNPAAALLKGTPTQLRRVSDLLPQLDIARPTTPETPLLDRTVTLRHVAFADVREFLVSQLPKVVIAPIPTNPKVAVVRASEADFLRLNELIAVVDLPKLISAEQERQLYLVDIPASSYQVQSSVQVQENGRTETRSETRSDYDKAKTWVRDNFLIFANREFESPATNWIVVEVGQTLKLLASIVASPAQQIRFQETLIRSRFGFEILPSVELNRPATPENENRVITLKHVGFATIKGFLEGQLPKISIAISPTNPGLAIVRGTPADLDKLAELLKIVDVPPLASPKSEPTIEKVYSLRNVAFSKVSEFLTGQLPKIFLAIVPTNPNLALVRGTAAELERLDTLLELADVAESVTPATSSPKLRQIYSLQNTTASTMISNLQDFLSRELPGARLQEIPGNPKAVWFEGSKGQIEEFDRLIKVVDVATPVAELASKPVVQKIFLLSHAQAKLLAPVIGAAVGARNAPTAASGSSTINNAQSTTTSSSGISIVADERTNALVVTGESSLVALVDDLVDQLDQPVPQVNIQVRVQEVTSSVVTNLGLRWETLAGGNILANLLETGLSLIFDSTRSLASLNLRVTLDALQEQGLSRTLNDSNITVLNNQTGRIQSGQTIFLRQTQPGTEGERSGTTEQVPFEIGVIVEVTPRIAADGSIVMQIVTDISGSNLQRNPTDGLIDRFDRQSSSSSLRIKDGQTIVLGGLIQKRSGQNSSGIPLLSEIPLLGSLFKQQKFEDSDRELLIVITGNIVKDAPTNRR